MLGSRYTGVAGELSEASIRSHLIIPVIPERFEHKFVIPVDQVEAVSAKISGNLPLDRFCLQNGFYVPVTLQLDSDEGVLAEEASPDGKIKLRVRCYAPLTDDSEATVLLEMKEKVAVAGNADEEDHNIRKHRIVLTYENYQQLFRLHDIRALSSLAPHINPEEMTSFLHFCMLAIKNAVRPVCFSAYHRVAFEREGGGPDEYCRATIDTRPRCIAAASIDFPVIATEQIFQTWQPYGPNGSTHDEWAIIELKGIRGNEEDWMSEMIRQLSATSVSYGKYKGARKALGLSGGIKN